MSRGGKREGGGRPKSANPRSAYVTIAVTPDEAQALTEAAKARAMTRSSWARAVLLERAAETPEPGG